MGYSFNGLDKVITLTEGTTELSVKDVWSRWVDWYLTTDNSKHPPTFMQLGGDDIDESSGISVPIYIFLLNGWKIKPQEANHSLVVSDGILVQYGGGDPFIDTDGYYNVRINYQQPVQVIATGEKGMTPGQYLALKD